MKLCGGQCLLEESEMNWFSAVRVQGVVLEETVAIHKAVEMVVIDDP